MSDFYVNVLSQVHQSLLCQTFEESQPTENLFVWFLKEVSFEIDGQTADELSIRFKIEFLLDWVCLSDIIIDFVEQVITDLVLLSQSARSLQVLFFGLILFGDVSE